MLDKFTEELKEARIKSGISLQQMALKTRIDIKFLEAIDKGDFAFLPEPYVKAFIKDYAKMVGLDEIKTIQKFEAAKKGKDLNEPEIVVEKPEKKTVTRKNVHSYDATLPKTPTEKTGDQNKNIIRYSVFAGVIILLLIIIYLLATRGSDEIVVAEKPFEEIIEDKQRFVEEEPEIINDNLLASDSLALVILSSDTSWVKIIIDDKKSDEFILFPNSQKTIKASDNYKITLGNSGGIKFQIDNKPLNFTGRKGSILHVQINKDGLTYLNAPPGL